MSVPVAFAPVPVRSAPEGNAELVTELVAGESLVAIEERAGWTRVVVPGHPSSLDERGYPGWVPPDAALAPVEGWRPEFVVSTANRVGLPLGTLLGRDGGAAALPGGETIQLEAGITPLAGAKRPASATDLAQALIGLPYRWGGTDSTTGMDCSGLVYRVMQVLGSTVPRDSGDQFERAPLMRSSNEAGWDEALRGDLVFFGEEAITHVGFYLGGGEYVSAHGGVRTGGVVVRAMTEDPYQGFARYYPT